MKKMVMITSLFFAGLLIAQAQLCDIQKFKIIKTYYGEVSQNRFKRIGELNGAVIYTEECPFLIPENLVVNVSEDTFSSDTKYEITMDFYLYGEAGLLLEDHNAIEPHAMNLEFRPNDTNNTPYMPVFPLLGIIDEIGQRGVDFEQITYWEMITGVSYTSQDGAYSDSVFHSGADTVVFQIVKGTNDIRMLENNQRVVAVYPNPAQSQLTVTNTENADIQLFNILGQKLFQTYGTKENTLINTASLPQGLYVLKVVKDNLSIVHKILITK